MDLNSFAAAFPDQQVHLERSADGANPELMRDEFFYLDILVFQVEMNLFRVPRHGFEVEGSLFQSLFGLPGPMENGEQVEGCEEKHPIVLGGITKEYFRGFLRVMYPFEDVTPTYDDWLGALDLATMWDFAKIRNRSIEALSSLLNDRPTTDKIILGETYHVKVWLVAGYTTLVTQEQLDLNQLSASSIDWPTISRLFSIREKILNSWMANPSRLSHACSRCGNTTTCYTAANNVFTPSVTDVEGHIARDFASELGDC